MYKETCEEFSVFKVFLRSTRGAIDYPQENYTYGEEIVDYGCHQTNQKCGINMIFKTVSEKLVFPYSYPVFRCIQRCICANNNYIENGKYCIKKEFLYHQTITEVNYLINDYIKINFNFNCSKIKLKQIINQINEWKLIFNQQKAHSKKLHN